MGIESTNRKTNQNTCIHIYKSERKKIEEECDDEQQKPAKMPKNKKKTSYIDRHIDSKSSIVIN